MGPPRKKYIPARSKRSVLKPFPLIYNITGTSYLSRRKKIKTTYACEIIYYSFQLTGGMETGSVPCLTSEEASRLVDDAAAAAAAAAAADAAAVAAAAGTYSGPALGNGSLPAISGIVHTANPPIPHSERSTLIRINRELKSKPTVLGGGGEPFFLQ